MQPVVCKEHLNFIVPGLLAVGDIFSGSSVGVLRDMGIRAIVACVGTLPLHDSIYRQAGIDVLQIPINDTPSENIKQYFANTNRFIHRYVQASQGVLVHCQAGVSRSVTIVMAYLLSHVCSEISVWSLLDWIRQRRPCANPNRGFIKQLQQTYEKRRNKSS